MADDSEYESLSESERGQVSFGGPSTSLGSANKPIAPTSKGKGKAAGQPKQKKAAKNNDADVKRRTTKACESTLESSNGEPLLCLSSGPPLPASYMARTTDLRPPSAPSLVIVQVTSE